MSLLTLVALACSACGPQKTDQQNVDWPVYLGDSGRQHYSALEQINRSNVSQLELAWVYDAGELRGSNSTMYTSPLVVDGVLYGLSPKLVAFALNAATGVELWRSDPGIEGTQRGLMWWQNGIERRLFYAAGSVLIALNAADGTPVTSFADHGRLDLTPPQDRGYIGVTVPGIVFEDAIIVEDLFTVGHHAKEDRYIACTVKGAIAFRLDSEVAVQLEEWWNFDAGIENGKVEDIALGEVDGDVLRTHRNGLVDRFSSIINLQDDITTDTNTGFIIRVRIHRDAHLAGNTIRSEDETTLPL